MVLTLDCDQRIYAPPRFWSAEGLFRPESGLQFIFAHDMDNLQVLSPHAQTVHGLPRDMRWGDPDAICRIGNNILFPIEVKRPEALTTDDGDLVGAYNQFFELRGESQATNSPIPPLQQIFGYLQRNNLTYGVLTTYRFTWFIYQDHQQNCIVSPGIRSESRDPTLLQAYLFFIRMVAATAQGKPDPFQNTPHQNPQNQVEAQGEQGQAGGGLAPNNDGDNADANQQEQGSGNKNVLNDMMEKDSNHESSLAG
jgi:hypothetical protein